MPDRRSVSVRSRRRTASHQHTSKVPKEAPQRAVTISAFQRPPQVGMTCEDVEMGQTCKVCRAWEAYADVGQFPRSDRTPPRGSARLYSRETFMIASRSEKKEDGLRGFEKKSAALSSVLTSRTRDFSLLNLVANEEVPSRDVLGPTVVLRVV